MQKKYIHYLLLIIMMFILNISFCYAETYYQGTITGTGVSLRSGPGTNYNKIKTLSKNNEYRLVNNTLHSDEGGCEKGWYNIYYDEGKTGYVCSSYVSVNTITYDESAASNCEEDLKNAGFPSSYWSSLCELKKYHSNWQFKALQTGLDWSTAVNKESSCGKSFIASSKAADIDTTCHNPYSKTWYPASSKAVAYYMDPRNWLTEQYIFQFEYLKYDSSLSSAYIAAATDVIDHAEFYKYHLGLGNNLGSIINDVGKEVDVSPIFIASRILQELGASTSLYNLYSGVYPDYNNYYNFYNMGVDDTCATENGATVCGLKYAKSNNWFGLSAAIKGGASQIASSYISKGQYTGYLQKYNVVPVESNKLYGHQYMTNIAAPSSEGKTAYNTYKASNLLNNVFVFYIPVYNNMDNTNYNASNGAVDTPDSSDPSKLAVSTIITSSGYKYTGGTIRGISPNTKISELKSSIESISGANTVVVKNSSGNIVSDGLIGTGFKITVNNSLTNETLTAIIKGDTSGDGVINALDLLQVQKTILGTYNLNNEYDTAGDTSGDGVINALDLLQVQKTILGSYKILQ